MNNSKFEGYKEHFHKIYIRIFFTAYQFDICRKGLSDPNLKVPKCEKKQPDIRRISSFEKDP